MKLLFRLSIVSILFTSCGVFVHHLTAQDLAWFNVYKKGDLLVFQNIATGQRDTTLISIRQVYHDYDWFLHSEFSHHRARLGYENNKVENVAGSKDRQGDMFFINKQNKNDTSPLAVSYLYSRFILNDTISSQVTLKLTSNDFEQVYCMSDERKKFRFNSIKSNEPDTLFWDAKYGIIKYVAYNGDVWERINWKN
jgi:hypothetical protein